MRSGNRPKRNDSRYLGAAPLLAVWFTLMATVMPVEDSRESVGGNLVSTSQMARPESFWNDSIDCVSPLAKTSRDGLNTSKAVLVLALLLGGFLVVQSLMPLRTAIRVGADEGFEYAKATLALKGYQFYTEIWNDQPLLHTFIITQVLKYLSPSVLGPRLVTSVFALLLLCSLFLISYRLHGLLVASLATGLLIASPGFLELASSCMVEIPALAPAVAAVWVLVVARNTGFPWPEVLAGALFAAALQIKFIGVIYLPLVGLVLLTRHEKDWASIPVIVNGAAKRAWRAALIFVTSLALSFVAINLLIGEGSYVLQLKQSWAAHFATPKSPEYGSPNEHPFEWSILLKNWDLTVPAIMGIIVSLRHARRTPIALLPLAWLALTFFVFASHKPWWSYYYVHNAVPLCLCAAAGLAGLVNSPGWRKSAVARLAVGIYAISTMLWMGARIYLQIDSVRHSPRTYSSLVLKELERYKPFSQFLFAEEPIYSFHSGIPLPPRLAVLSLKRFWSGDLTNAGLVEELRKCKPGVVLLANDTRERPFVEWLHAEYTIVYQDAGHRLYARKAVVEQADPWPTPSAPRR